MDKVWLLAFYPLIIWFTGACMAVLVLYGAVRVAVSRGLRDHQKWMERNRPSASIGALTPEYRPISPPPADIAQSEF